MDGGDLGALVEAGGNLCVVPFSLSKCQVLGSMELPRLLNKVVSFPNFECVQGRS